MRKTKQVEVQFEDGTTKSVLIKELSLGQIEALSMEAIQLPAKLQTNPNITEEIKAFFKDNLVPITTNLSFDEVKHMFPSDLEEVWLGIQEVNKSFFTLLINLNIVEWGKQVVGALIQHLVGSLVSGQSAVPSLKQDTLVPQNTDTPTP